jgi:hypothetical protein
VLGAVLNGRRLDPPAGGRLALPGLGADNVLTAEAEVARSRSGQGLTSFTDPADGAAYVTLTRYPSSAPGVFCCFDQSDLTATVTVAVAVPGGWECIANGPVTQRPSGGRPGLWRFAPVPAMAPCEVALCAGPLLTEPNPGSVARGPAPQPQAPGPGERPAPVTTAGTIPEPAGNANIRATARPVHGSRRWQRVRRQPAQCQPA